MRYPGGKTKMARDIVRRIPTRELYVEPFIGAGSVFQRLGNVRAVLNDADPGIYAYWEAIRSDPARLTKMVNAYVPKPADFYRYRDLLNDPDVLANHDIIKVGFMKLAIHQISFSGLGSVAGSPIGGRDQSSAWAVGCRWNPVQLSRDIQRLASRSFRVTNYGFRRALRRYVSRTDVACYLDPPYVERGVQLYLHSMTEKQHRDLASLLRDAKCWWLLSYDDHPLVREMYGKWCRVEATTEQDYTIASGRVENRRVSELLITPKEQP